MGLFRNKLNRRFKTLGLISDLALVGGAAARLIQRRGDRMSRAASMTEMALAAGAVLRLLRRLGRRRKQAKAPTAITVN